MCLVDYIFHCMLEGRLVLCYVSVEFVEMLAAGVDHISDFVMQALCLDINQCIAVKQNQ